MECCNDSLIHFAQAVASIEIQPTLAALCGMSVSKEAPEGATMRDFRKLIFKNVESHAQSSDFNGAALLLLAHLLAALPKIVHPRIDLAKAIESRLFNPAAVPMNDFQYIVQILAVSGKLLQEPGPVDAGPRVCDILEWTLAKLREFLVSGEGSIESRSMALYILELNACAWKVLDD